MTGFHKGSWPETLSTLEVGERIYVDSTLEDFPKDMRRLNPAASRRRGVLVGMEFSTNLFTAVSSSKAGDVRYLVCVERTA